MRNPTLSTSMTIPPLRVGLLLLFLSSAIKGVAAGIPGPSYVKWIIISVVGSIVLTVIVNLLCCYCRRYSNCCCNDEEEKETTKTESSTTKVAIVNADGRVIREAQPAIGTNEKPAGTNNHAYETVGYMTPVSTNTHYEPLRTPYDDVRGDPNLTSPKTVD